MGPSRGRYCLPSTLRHGGAEETATRAQGVGPEVGIPLSRRGGGDLPQVHGVNQPFSGLARSELSVSTVHSVWKDGQPTDGNPSRKFSRTCPMKTSTNARRCA